MALTVGDRLGHYCRPHATLAAAYREVFGRLRAPRRHTPAVAQVRTVLDVPSVVSKYAWRQLHGIVRSFGERTLASGLGPRSHLFPAFETSGKERGVTVDGGAQFVAVRTRERDTGQLPPGFAERPEHGLAAGCILLARRRGVLATPVPVMRQ